MSFLGSLVAYVSSRKHSKLWHSLSIYPQERRHFNKLILRQLYIARLLLFYNVSRVGKIWWFLVRSFLWTYLKGFTRNFLLIKIDECHLVKCQDLIFYYEHLKSSWLTDVPNAGLLNGEISRKSEGRVVKFVEYFIYHKSVTKMNWNRRRYVK